MFSSSILTSPSNNFEITIDKIQPSLYIGLEQLQSASTGNDTAVWELAWSLRGSTL